VAVRGRRYRQQLALLAGAALVAAACGSVKDESPVPASPSVALQTAAAPTVSPPSSGNPTAALPAFGHIWVIVLENKSYDAIEDSQVAPFLSGLIAQGGLATAYSGVGRPSQPNYLALFSGSTQGVTDDAPHDIDAPNLADQLEAAGRTWGEYAENVPAGCFPGETASGGRDGSGEYARKHAPAISFDSIRSNPARCANIHDLAAFKPGVVDYALIVPNLCHDMHDCSIPDGDAWLRGFVPQITASAAFRDGGLLVVTFDEGDPHAQGDARVATILVSPAVKAGSRSAIEHDHYSLLRTIQSAWGLDCLAESCRANTLGEFFSGS
jgi:phosphatidylinositol-3-phosphatase